MVDVFEAKVEDKVRDRHEGLPTAPGGSGARGASSRLSSMIFVCALVTMHVTPASPAFLFTCSGAMRCWPPRFHGLVQVVTCVRLLREWDGECLRRSLDGAAEGTSAAASSAAEGSARGVKEEREGEEATGTGGVAAPGEGGRGGGGWGGEQLLAELCVDQQIVDHVESTGTEGVLQPQVRRHPSGSHPLCSSPASASTRH